MVSETSDVSDARFQAGGSAIDLAPQGRRSDPRDSVPGRRRRPLPLGLGMPEITKTTLPNDLPLYRISVPGTRALTILLAFDAGARTRRRGLGAGGPGRNRAAPRGLLSDLVSSHVRGAQ